MSAKHHNHKKSDTSHDRLMQMLTTALGMQIGMLLNDPGIVEVMLNPDGHLWIDRLGEGRSDTGFKMTGADAERVIYLVASATGAVCSHHNPRLSAELPGNGSRFQGFLPPVVSAPSFIIRKKAIMVFTLNDYVEKGIMTADQRERIIEGVRNKENILIIGGTGTGKTTLANAILSKMAELNDRIITIEDTLELQCTAPDSMSLRANAEVSMDDLLRDSLRSRPDRIVVGEVRGPEALTFLKALNTGHPGGMGTLHANSTLDGLLRLELLIQEAKVPPMPQLIAQAINLVIFIERYEHGRRIGQIATVDGHDGRQYILKNQL